MLQACLNGGRSRREHPAIPLTPAALGRDAGAVRAAGADGLHVHPRTAGGRESLDADVVATAPEAIRATVPGMPLGISTGALGRLRRAVAARGDAGPARAAGLRLGPPPRAGR